MILNFNENSTENTHNDSFVKFWYSKKNNKNNYQFYTEITLLILLNVSLSMLKITFN